MNNGSHIQLLERARTEFAQRADLVRAQAQKAYMKSSMPYWGVSMPEVKKLGALLIKGYVPRDQDDYRATVLYLFKNAQYREEWYLGMLYARKFKKFVIRDNLDLYLEVVKLTQWWDIVDELAAKLVGDALKNEADLREVLGRLIVDENMWVRRTALLTQLQYKEKIDADLLAELILIVAHEKEFFIRKAIGWILRQYSYTNPDWVVAFIQKHEDKLSGLSVREGLKAVKRSGLYNQI